MDKENDLNHTKKRRVDESNCKNNETSCYQSKEINDRFNYNQDVSNSNYSSKLQSKINMNQKAPTELIKIKLLNGKNLDLKMYADEFSCFDVSLTNLHLGIFGMICSF